MLLRWQNIKWNLEYWNSSSKLTMKIPRESWWLCVCFKFKDQSGKIVNIWKLFRFFVCLNLCHKNVSKKANVLPPVYQNSNGLAMLSSKKVTYFPATSNAKFFTKFKAKVYLTVNNASTKTTICRWINKIVCNITMIVLNLSSRAIFCFCTSKLEITASNFLEIYTS